MKIGELAERAGMAASAIRYYEKLGLLPRASRGANGYRAYPEESVERLRLIALGQSLGFTLDAIRSVMALEGEALHAGLMQGIAARMEEIDRMTATLQAQRAALLETRQRLRESWDRDECLKC